MGTTPIFDFYYPDDATSNDIHAHVQALAVGVETEITRQGTLENRPAAGVRGRLYWTTTRVDPFSSSTVAWNVLYRDDGTAWHQLTPSAMQTYTPAWTAPQAAGNYTLSLISDSENKAEYSIDNNKCFVNVSQLIQLNGTSYSGGIFVTLPVGAVSHAMPAAHAQNRPCETFLNATSDQIEFYGGDYSNSQLRQVNAPFWFRATATYRIA